jgi:GNAT superfamily N-acetyltransferase
MSTISELLALYDNQLRLVVPLRAPKGHVYDRQGQLLRVSGRSRGLVETSQTLNCDNEALDALIVAQRNFFASRGEAVEWKTRAHDLPANIPERLLAAGFVPEETETVMVAETAQLVTKVNLPSGVTITTVNEPADFDQIVELQSEVWGGDFSWLVTDFLDRKAAAPGDLVVLVAEVGGRIVSAAWLVFAHAGDFAGLWGGSTLTEWRGQGIYKALVALRAEAALERGVKYLQVDASDDSKPILQRLGFLPLTTTTPYVWCPTGN